MALKSHVRRWLGVPSDKALGHALTELRGEVERLGRESERLGGEVERLAGEGARRADEGAHIAGELTTLRALGEEQEAIRRQEIDVLHNALSAFAERFDAHISQTYATTDDLAEVQGRNEDRDAKVEDIRLSIAGLAAQLRWESDDLRKGLVAIIERVERQRKPA